MTREDTKVVRDLIDRISREQVWTAVVGQVAAVFGALAAVVDRLSFGVLLADGDARVLFANDAARRMLARRDGLSVDGERCLRAANAADTTALHGFIATGTGGALAVARPSGEPAFGAVVVPTSERRGHEVLVLIADADDAGVGGEPATLRRVYGLTAAEARLTALLAQGLSVTRASQQLGVSVNTARTHLKRAFAKTRTRRQAELVRLVMLHCHIRL